MKLKLAEKDLAIKSLHDQLERGEASEHIKHMQQEIEMCLKEKEMERNARIQLEKNLEQMNTTFTLLRQSKFDTHDDVVLMQVSPLLPPHANTVETAMGVLTLTHFSFRGRYTSRPRR